jgi:hypothetical protein
MSCPDGRLGFIAAKSIVSPITSAFEGARGHGGVSAAEQVAPALIFPETDVNR